MEDPSGQQSPLFPDWIERGGGEKSDNSRAWLRREISFTTDRLMLLELVSMTLFVCWTFLFGDVAALFHLIDHQLLLVFSLQQARVEYNKKHLP